MSDDDLPKSGLGCGHVGGAYIVFEFDMLAEPFPHAVVTRVLASCKTLEAAVAAGRLLEMDRDDATPDQPTMPPRVEGWVRGQLEEGPVTTIAQASGSSQHHALYYPGIATADLPAVAAAAYAQAETSPAPPPEGFGHQLDALFADREYELAVALQVVRHHDCELYDRTVCTGWCDDFCMPATPREVALVSHNARRMFEEMRGRARELGVSDEALGRAKEDPRLRRWSEVKRSEPDARERIQRAEDRRP